jgi:hypothetical protein
MLLRFYAYHSGHSRCYLPPTQTAAALQGCSVWELVVRGIEEQLNGNPEPEHRQLESAFRRMTSRRHPSSKQWPDACLSAFAETAGVILVTFDRALHQMNGGKPLLLK